MRKEEGEGVINKEEGSMYSRKEIIGQHTTRI